MHVDFCWVKRALVSWSTLVLRLRPAAIMLLRAVSLYCLNNRSPFSKCDPQFVVPGEVTSKHWFVDLVFVAVKFG